MTKITEVEDRGATVAWSPVSSHADYLALGVKVSAFGRGTLQNAIYVVSSDPKTLLLSRGFLKKCILRAVPITTN